VNSLHEAFWQRHPGLVWSNPDASDDVRIRAALLRPRFSEILDIASEFSIERLEREWGLLCDEDTPEARRAAGEVERILLNVRRGAAVAARRD
jgi:hypothetical protein